MYTTFRARSSHPLISGIQRISRFDTMKGDKILHVRAICGLNKSSHVFLFFTIWLCIEYNLADLCVCVHFRKMDAVKVVPKSNANQTLQ